MRPRKSVFFLVVLGQVLKHTEHLARATIADTVNILAQLQDFTRNVERQIGRIDHAADKRM